MIIKKSHTPYTISIILAIAIIIKLVDYHRSPEIKTLGKEQVGILQNEELNIVLGEATAPITMILYYNYACNSCRLFLSETFLSVKRDFIDKGLVCAILKPVEYENNEINRLDIQAALCMDKLDLFLPMNEYLILRHKTHQSVEAVMNDFAQLNEDLMHCLLNGESIEQIERNNKQLSSLQIKATPTIIINNKIYKGSFPYVAFQRILERELKSLSLQIEHQK